MVMKPIAFFARRRLRVLEDMLPSSMQACSEVSSGSFLEMQDTVDGATAGAAGADAAGFLKRDCRDIENTCCVEQGFHTS